MGEGFSSTFLLYLLSTTIILPTMIKTPPKIEAQVKPSYKNTATIKAVCKRALDKNGEMESIVVPFEPEVKDID